MDTKLKYMYSSCSEVVIDNNYMYLGDLFSQVPTQTQTVHSFWIFLETGTLYLQLVI